MPIGGIGGGGENPFLKKMEELKDLKNNSPDTVNSDIKTTSPDKTSEVKKTDMDKGQSENNADNHNAGAIDRSQFTNESDMQEIDLEEFEDDFK